MDNNSLKPFESDVIFLRGSCNPELLLSDDHQAQVAVSAKFQGKVFTSTDDKDEGRSLGYINRKAFENLGENEHINAYGGENRIWVGPEGGSFSIFFKPGTKQIYDNWFTPKPFDSEYWRAYRQSRKSIEMLKMMELDNYLGTHFSIMLERKISLVEKHEIKAMLGVAPHENVKTVAYTTDNRIANMNDFTWDRQTGTLCIWILDMFKTSPRAVTIVPYTSGSEEKLGRIATSDYFGAIPDDRYREKDGNVFLKTDGKYRSKIGLSAARTKAVAANYDPDSHHLVVVKFDVDRNAIYLNQEWNPDKDPMTGDAFNAYNDGPLEDGSIMGPFLELESNSPAAMLEPGKSLKHIHSVFHFVGEEKYLSAITETLFGISIEEIKLIF